jgi:valyl-tRNA synthetase
MPELSPVYDPKITEEKIYKLWEQSGYFNHDAADLRRSKRGFPRKKYSIHLPPPNITGSLHMGHALNATISDILIRYHRMRGYKTVWFPGIDHAGIATQNVVEKELKKEGKTRFDLGREKFIERVWQWTEKYGTIILDQLKKLGASGDWSRTRFTMDPSYADWVKKAFIHYYEKGLIHRGLRTINWCPRCATSLSDLELEYAPEKAVLYYIKYGPFTLATVRPETKFGDTALAVNPKDKRYKKYVGRILEVDSLSTAGTLDKPELAKIKLFVVADEAVDPKFGTGIIKVTPAHDITDFEISERHQLPMVQVIDERGRMNKNAGKYAGMKVGEARRKIVEDLKAVGLLEKEEPYEHRVTRCYRCGSTIEPLPSQQWFLKMTDLAKNVLKAVKSKKVKIIPKNFEKILTDWLKNIRDWCISRQIWWGHRLPVWFHEPKCVPRQGQEKEIVKCKEFIVSTAEPKCQYCNAKLVQSEDVLDTWFSSALWPFAGLSEKDLKDFYPSNVLITARDIINLWVARMIFSGLEFMKKVPFPEVLIHATILTKEGKRMSKSLGTGLDPLELIEKYGADAARFGIIWQAMGTQDIHWDETAVQAGKKFANKVWNIARFCYGKIGNSKFQNLSLREMPRRDTNYKQITKSKLQKEDKEILTKLKNLKKQVEKDIKNYELGQTLHKIYNFVWHEFADKYIETSKKREDEAVKKVLQYILRDILNLLHPFMPFITDEIKIRK